MSVNKLDVAREDLSAYKTENRLERAAAGSDHMFYRELLGDRYMALDNLENVERSSVNYLVLDTFWCKQYGTIEAVLYQIARITTANALIYIREYDVKDWYSALESEWLESFKSDTENVFTSAVDLEKCLLYAGFATIWRSSVDEYNIYRAVLRKYPAPEGLYLPVTYQSPYTIAAGTLEQSLSLLKDPILQIVNGID